MSPREWKFRIEDILAAINSILSYTADLSYENFIQDRKTVDAVIRNLIVIGEAAVHLPDEVCSFYNTLPWNEMRSMRNFMVHEYFGISDKIIWNTIHQNLPSLIAPLRSILNDCERSG